jgi:membrane-bound serine protease (ClpP class)
VNYAGIALLVLAGVFFVAEIKVTSYGLLSLAGVVSLVLGYVLLFKSTDPAVRVSWSVIVSLTAFTVAVVAVLFVLVVRTHRGAVRTGSEGLLQEPGVARTDLAPTGKVFVHGELWHARAAQPIAAGTPVRIIGVEGMTVVVEPSA